MPIPNKAASVDSQESELLDDPSSVANDNAAQISDDIPKPMGWREATAFVAASSTMAVVLTFCLLFAVLG